MTCLGCGVHGGWWHAPALLAKHLPSDIRLQMAILRKCIINCAGTTTLWRWRSCPPSARRTPGCADDSATTLILNTWQHTGRRVHCQRRQEDCWHWCVPLIATHRCHQLYFTEYSRQLRDQPVQLAPTMTDPLRQGTTGFRTDATMTRCPGPARATTISTPSTLTCVPSPALHLRRGG